MNTHHLIMGKLKDFLTGNMLDDTHDERYRQKLARFLVEDRQYRKEDITSGRPLVVSVENKKAVIKIDFLVTVNRTVAMLIKYGPGSLVSRQRSALAMSRLVSTHQMPVIVVTNGEDAAILDGTTGDVIGTGLDAIPPKSELVEKMKNMVLKPVSEKRKQMEQRIVYAFEVNDSCPCDDSICRIGSDHES